jgi:hypothetical protein
MDENNKGGEKGGEGAPVVPELNAFGEPTKQPAEKISEGGEGEGEKGKGEKETPTDKIANLSKKLGEYEQKEKGWGETQKSKDENIRAMKATIEGLKKQIGEKGVEKGEGDKGEGKTVLFKEVKTSKELTQDEKDEMTDTEIKQFDEIASLKQGMNQLAELIGKKNAEKAPEDKIDIQATVKAEALKLAKNDVDMANQIIESAKQFSFADLTVEEIAQRVEKSATLVPTYKRPKEQTNAGGGKPAGGGTDTDPYHIDGIVKDVTDRNRKQGFDL